MTLQTPKVLIVDNRVGASHALDTVLRQNGYQVLLLTNPIHLVESLAQQLPDVVLMEEELPDLCGGQLCRQIKALEDLQHIRVVMHSRSMRLHNPDYVQAIGADAILRKPCATQELLMTVAQQLTVAH